MNVLRRGLLVLALCLPALVPLFSIELPRSADGRAHLFRLVLMAEHLRAGEWWPRYSPELVYGFGYPLFNYYAPLTYYAGALLHLLGLNAILALHVLMAFTVLVGAGGVYVLAQEWFANEWSGALAAAVYVFAPYTLFNLYPRAAVPEALAVALLPWLWWSARRALLALTAFALVRLALLYAVLLLTHNLTALVGTALLGSWFLYEVFALKPHISPFGRLACASGSGAGRAGRFTLHASLTTLSLISGLALSAIFWLPAFLETNAVQVAQLTSPATLDFRNYFLTPAQLLTPTFTFDPKLEPPTFPVALGWPQFFLPLAALAVWPRLTTATERWRIALLFGLWLGFVFLTTALSQSIWELFAPLKIIQFPWRFLGPATLCAALLAGAPLAVLASRPVWARALTLGLITLTALLAFPWTFITRYPATQLPPQPTATDIFAYEVASGGYGLTSTGEFLPVAVQQLPAADPAWAATVVSGTASRLEVASLPNGVSIQSAVSKRLSAQATFTSNQSFTAMWRWFYFPGWQATLDGQTVPIVPSVPFGFITVAVPAGEHTVRMHFESTPLRQVAGGLSLLGLLGVLVLAWYARKHPPAALISSSSAGKQIDSRFTFFVLLFALAIFIFRLAIQNLDTPFQQSRFDGQTVVGLAQPLNVNFGDALTLLGFDPPTPVPADEPLAFTLYWGLPAPVSEDFSIAVQVWDAAGNLVGQQDAWHPNNAPTSRWLPGHYAIDAHSFTVFPGTPPGQYRLMVAVYVYAAPGNNLEVKTAEGTPLGRVYEVAALTVLPPTRPSTEAELNPAQLLRAPLGRLELIGVDGLRSQLSAGDEVPLVFYWHVGDAALANVALQLELVTENGTRTPLGAQLLFGEPRAVLRASLLYLVPAQTPAGRAQLQASLVSTTGERLAEPINLGAVEVSVPARTFTTPAVAVPLTARFGAGMELLGYALSPTQPFTVTLYWRAAELVSTRYKVSLQVLDAAGQIVAQVDTEPVQGTRPTTSWLPPEVLTDVYTLPPLPASVEAYTLQVVVYEPRSGTRLTVADSGAEQVVLQTLMVK